MYPLGTKILVDGKPAIYIYQTGTNNCGAVIRYEHERDTRVVPARKVQLVKSA